MEETIHSELVVSEPKQSTNRALLQELERKRALLEAGCGVIGSAVIGVFIASNPLLLSAGLAVLGFGLKKIQKLTQITKNAYAILDAFEDQQDIEITTQIAVPKHGSLDMIVKFMSAKVNFAIALRSQGKAIITYRKEKEALYCRNKTGGIKPWVPDHIERLNEQEFWIRKYNKTLLGSSSRQRSRPLVKLLVLTGETKLGNSSEDLYVKMGTEKILMIKKKVIVYVMEERQLVSFLEASIASKV